MLNKIAGVKEERERERESRRPEHGDLFNGKRFKCLHLLTIKGNMLFSRFVVFCTIEILDLRHSFRVSL